MDSDEINKLYRVWRTLMQMMQDRNYNVPDALLMLSLNGFKQKLGESKTRECLILQLAKNDDEDSKIMLYFPDEIRITVPIIASIAQKMHKESIKRTVMVGKGNITPSAKQAITEVQTHFIIEYFEEKELLVNITEHELVPKHIVMTDVEKQALLKRYRVKEGQLPKIQVTDPVARYFGLSRGQVVKIIRTSETAGRYITYRLAA
jgi:DNA-directed RNA polymerases I, II, and III subunit RPABC1